MLDPVATVARELGVQERQVKAAASLFDEGATVPFVARYRKEATGSLDEVQLAAVRDGLARIAELEKRRESVLGSLAERDLLTPELKGKIASAVTLAEVEDLFLPYRPKRRTRAQIARERGLEPLAEHLWRQDGRPFDAAAFVDVEQGVDDEAAALAGARDILAERVSEHAGARARLRELFASRAVLSSKVVKSKEEEAARFRDWFDWSEPLRRAPSHRVLALLRGEREGMLRVRATPDEDECRRELERRFLKGSPGPAREEVREAIHDSWKRLLGPSLEAEALREAKLRADEEAIRVFADNAREMLLAAPLGAKRVLALDPGFRTGCKVTALDATGELLEHGVVHPHQGASRRAGAADQVRELCRRHRIEAIAVGNGTAGRETEAFLRELDLGVPVAMVNEAGASIYSASEVARAELPDHDLTVRGSVSIGRRLQDPLAELVKIDPKSIGVGQYQHDVDQGALKRGLDDVVTSCVNAVGVEINSASAQLLTYVAGLGPKLANSIVEHRAANGPFPSRAALKKVPRLGAKAFEQCAGFLRVRGAKNPLDASAVHPERYSLVERMAKDQGCTVKELLGDGERRGRIDPRRYVGDGVGEPTLRDILGELARPGRDPRPTFETFAFADVHELSDLSPGMRIPGVVTNVTNFGAFVDVGVHQDGLVHVSQLADRFVREPGEVVKVGQRVQVRVLEVDLERKRIALSMRSG